MTVRIRASDADRARVAATLQKHTAAGRLTLDEYDQRVVAAWRATTLDDLPALTADVPALTADLPAEPSPQPPAPQRPPAVERLAVTLRKLCCCGK